MMFLEMLGGLQALFFSEIFEVAPMIVYVVGMDSMVHDQKGNNHQSRHVKTNLWCCSGRATAGAMTAAARTNATESLI